MENKDRIYENLELTMLAHRNGIAHIQFYLAGVVPAEVIWEDGLREKIEIAGRIKIEPFSEGKQLINRRVALKLFTDKIKKEYVEELVAAIESGLQKAQEAKELGGKPFTMLALV